MNGVARVVNLGEFGYDSETRRGGRVDDGDGLENRCTCKRTVGSNPTPSATDSIMELLGSLNIEGTTVILITHDMGTADMCFRRIELKDGRILHDTTESEGELCE